MDSKALENIYFPYDAVRPIQSALVQQLTAALEDGTDVIAHAPTGLGKTAAALSPAIANALKNKKSIFFLTSRHTQHRLAVDTLKEIRQKHNLQFAVADIVGKKWMCAQEGVEALFSNEFASYCKTLRENKQCNYYENVKNKEKVSDKSKAALRALAEPVHTDEIVSVSKEKGVCPYEIGSLIAQNAVAIVADYNYIFNTGIREAFLKKIGKSLDESILIIDEGHNLPERMRGLMTQQLSSVMIERALTDARKAEHEELAEKIVGLQTILAELAANVDKERLITKNEFSEKLAELGDVEEFIADLVFLGEELLEKQKQTSLNTVAEFLENWGGQDEGFVRILEMRPGAKKPIVSVSYRCLDPSIATQAVIEAAHATVLMSGTLTPTNMYKDLLGFGENTIESQFRSPFPSENKIALVYPNVTTKYSRRSPQEYERIAKAMAETTNTVPGNTVVFFPSYSVRDNIHKYFHDLCDKTVFVEHPGMSKDEKHELLEKFKAYHETGAVLLAVVGGSFGEGVDFPGDVLKCVVVVGLPLQTPNLESKAVIEYYDKKFGKGWDYGYIFPAFNKVLQNAGRCIRSETDRGVLVFLDERYGWPRYSKLFPADYQLTVTRSLRENISEFFS